MLSEVNLDEVWRWSLNLWACLICGRHIYKERNKSACLVSVDGVVLSLELIDCN